MTLFFQLTLYLYLLATAVYVAHFLSQQKQVRTVARAILLAGGILHTVYFIVRYVAAGHTPLTSNHEAVSFFAWSMTWAFLSFWWRYRVKNFGVFVSPLVSLLMLIAAFSSQEMAPLPPALRSNWLPVHASIAIMANGFMALAFCGGVMYLLQEREIKKKKFGIFYSRLPSLEALDSLNQHCLALGFLLLTLGIITGSVWAKQAWGAYWQWDPKETWSLITWLIYAAILHQRLTMGWRRRRAAIMAIVGFGAVLFTLWGVTYLLGECIPMLAESIVIIGVNHKTAPVAVREKLAFSGDCAGPLLTLMDIEGCQECCFLSTCNRVEVIFVASDPAAAAVAVRGFLFAKSGLADAEAQQYSYLYQGKDAVEHLYNVAASLDSMVVGEPQILGQLKQAYREALEQKTTGVILNRLLHKSFSVAKRVRTETNIGGSAVSISYAAVQLAKKILGNLQDKSVLLVGAGEMAELAAEHLVRQGIGRVIVANRTLERAVKLAHRFNGTAVGLAELTTQLAEVDILVSSTGATDLILTKDQVKPLMRQRKNRPLFLIDIAVPRDLDPELNDLDNVYLYDIDDLKNVVDVNKAEREKEALRAEGIVAEEVVKFGQWLEGMELAPTITAIRQKANGIREAEVAKTLSTLKSLSENERRSVEMLANAIVNKLLHEPMVFLKNSAPHDNPAIKLAFVRQLFGLDKESSDQ